MGGHDDNATLSAESLQVVENDLLADQVQRRAWFIQDQNLRVVGNCTADGNPFFHAAGQLQNLAVQKVVNLQVSQYTGLQLLRKGVTASGVPQAQVVFHRKLLKERCGLGNVADYMRTKSRAVEKIAGLRERGLFKKKFPFISLQCTCKDSEQCRLSAAILPENAD